LAIFKRFESPFAALVLVASACLFLQRWWGNWLFAAFYSGGTIVIMGVVIMIARRRRIRFASALNLLPAALLLLYYTRIADRVAESLTFLKTTATYDGYLLYIDRSFGFSPSLLVSHFVGGLHLLSFFFWIYLALAIAIGASFAIHIGNGQPNWRIVLVLLIAVVVGASCYNLLPACGPRMLLGPDRFLTGNVFAAAFPNSRPSMVAVAPKYPRNAMPSLHMTWALLVLWLSRSLKRWHLAAAVFAFLTAVATLAIGEHYLVDLVVAFPFALAIWSLCLGAVPLSDPKRTLKTVGAMCLFFGWIAVMRFVPTVFYAARAVPWGASILTVCGTLWAVYIEPPITFGIKAGEERVV
jgi:hypothetical protein